MNNDDWKNISSETRKKIKEFCLNNKNLEVIFEEIFGRDNLESQKEPEEILHLPRRILIDKCREEEPRSLYILKKLFGPKCSPDFHPGDKVRIISEYGNPEATIRSVLGNGNYYLEGRGCEYPGMMLISSEKFDDTEEKFKIKQKEEYFELVNKPFLNLIEKLRNHIGETFFSISDGEVILKGISNTVISVQTLDSSVPRIDFWPSGVKYYTSGLPSLFPSKDLYLKYPLLPEKAWEEWEKTVKSFKLNISFDDNPEIMVFEFKTKESRDSLVNKLISEYESTVK